MVVVEEVVVEVSGVWGVWVRVSVVVSVEVLVVVSVEVLGVLMISEEVFVVVLETLVGVSVADLMTVILVGV